MARTIAGPLQSQQGSAGSTGDRVQFHLLIAVSGLFASAALSLSWLASPAVELGVARWLSVATVAGFGAVWLASSAARRRRSLPSWLDAFCTCCEHAVLLGWVHATGSASSYLSAFPPLLAMGHRISGGKAMGLVAAGFACAAHLGVSLLEVLDVLSYAPVAPNSAHAAGMNAVGAAAVLTSYAAAFSFGGVLSRKRSTAPRGSKAVSRSPKGRYAGRILAGKYRLIGFIGRGGTGEVYVAEQHGRKPLVAVKILHAHLSEVPQVVARFWREVQSSACLPHERVAKVLDFGVDGELKYLVMERLEGESLSTRLQRDGKLPPADAVRMIEQVGEALQAAAEHGIVHRDVKPSNIFLVRHHDARLDTRLLDFGICRLQEGAFGPGVSRTAVLVGTPGFLAPEQVADGFGEVGPHTDVFALAAVAYRALSGKSAFPSRRLAEAVYEALNHHPRPLQEVAPELPAQLESVLLIGLAKAPHDRYRSAAEFARDLADARDGALSHEVIARASALRQSASQPSSTLTTAA